MLVTQVELDNSYDEEEVINKNNKRSKVRGISILRQIFQTFELGVEFLMNDFEAKWSKERTRQTSEGLKEYKWTAKEKNSTINTFLSYFKKEWIDSKNHGWFEGFSINYPSTYNGLESVIVLAVNLKAVTIPTRYIRINIEPKAKVGRKANAKSCLIRQESEGVK
ncbi:unnamed protein product [Brachionus calyciflorus]|uniref:Uncharacterized protein n=1 Tax=Brachionus calyciflorus TaxID=104777 RepID=A0A813ZSQ1_9BILA|nr:unnamed protein product [Brachionus calyciflorus]